MTSDARTDWYGPGGRDGSGHQGDGSQAAEPSRRRLIDHAYTAVALSTLGGLTWREYADENGLHHGQASSALSNLHRQGRVARLAEKRRGSGVYVLPVFVDDRPVITYRTRPQPPTVEQIEDAVNDYWHHARVHSRDRLVEILCDRLGVAR